MKFMIRYFDEIKKVTVKEHIQTHTIGQALTTAIAIMKGKDISGMAIIQEDEE